MRHLIITYLLLTLATTLFAQNAILNPPKSHNEMVENRGEIPPALPQIKQSTSGFLQKLDRFEDLYWDDNTQSYFKWNETTYWYNPNSSLGKYQYVSYKKDNNPISWGQQYVYEYSADTTVHTQTHLKLDTLTGNWNSYKKWEIYYNAAKDMDYFDYFNWNKSTLSWEKTHMYEYTYSNDGKIELLEASVWNTTTSSWNNYYKETTMYDANGWDTLYQEFEWETGTNSWVLQGKDQFEYDTNGNIIRETNTKYYTGGIFSAQKWERTYNAQNKMASQASYIWNGPTIQWTKSYIQDYTYNTFNDLVLIEDTTEDGGTWSLYRKTNLSYDITVPASELVLPRASQFQNQYMGLIRKNWESNTWKNYNKMTYYYSDFDPVSVQELAKGYSNAFPNPFNTYISFNLSNSDEKYFLEVFDGLGKRVIAQSLINNEKIDTQNLGAGFYIYTLTSKNETITGKMIKN